MNGVLDSIYSEARIAIEGFLVTLRSAVIAEDQCLKQRDKGFTPTSEERIEYDVWENQIEIMHFNN